MICTLGAWLVLNTRHASAYSGGPPTASTGAPNESTCAVCHFSTVNTGGGAVTITGLPSSYTPGQQVDVTVTVTFSGRRCFGFELIAIDDSGKQAGTFTLTGSGRMQIVSDNINGQDCNDVEHTSDGTVVPAPGRQNSWSFKQTAPATNVGKVTFYAAGNAANFNNPLTGDNIYTTSAVVQAPLPSFATVSGAHYRNEAVAAESFVSGFGQGFTTPPGFSATELPQPTALAGVSVMVKDSTNTERASPLFFVGQNQINYLLPAGTQPGAATVTVLKSNQTSAVGGVSVVSVAPGIFTANAAGTGVAAAVV